MKKLIGLFIINNSRVKAACYQSACGGNITFNGKTYFQCPKTNGDTDCAYLISCPQQ